jgi:type VI protein secretion system component VasK
MAGAFEKAGTFLALVGGAGYAGLFAIWGWVSPYLQRWETLTIAASVGTSLLIFIVWQLYGQFTIAKQQMDFSLVISSGDADFDAEFAKLQQKIRKGQNKLRRIWRPALTAIAIPGVAGGLLLVAACVRHLICDAR